MIRPAPFRTTALTLAAALLCIAHAASTHGGTDPAPRRIVSLTPGVTEILFELGLDRRIGGVTDFCNFPPEAKRKPSVGGFSNPSAEKIIALEPDLVIVAPNVGNRQAVETVRRLGVPVLVVQARNLDELFETIAAIGTATGRESRARALVDHLRAVIDRLVDGVAGRHRPRVLLALSRDPFIVAGAGSYPGELIRLAGGAAPDFDPASDYPRVGIETILEWSPEVILEPGAGAEAARRDLLASWRRWPGLPAVAGGRIHPVSADLVSRPGPRVAAALRELIRILHPETIESPGAAGGSDG